jgi:hypothetical protein
VSNDIELNVDMALPILTKRSFPNTTVSEHDNFVKWGLAGPTGRSIAGRHGAGTMMLSKFRCCEPQRLPKDSQLETIAALPVTQRVPL